MLFFYIFKNFLKTNLCVVIMMAFVGTSFAKNREVEVKKCVVVEAQTSTLESPSDACDDVWRALYVHYLGNGTGAAAATAATKKADYAAATVGC